jgi:hypothetical protein
MPIPLQETSLKTLLTRTAAQQSLLAGLHPTVRAGPLAVFAVAGLVQRRTGVDLLDRVLGGGNAMIELPDIPSAPLLHAEARGRLWAGCDICNSNANALRGRLTKGGNPLMWLLDRSAG